MFCSPNRTKIKVLKPKLETAHWKETDSSSSFVLQQHGAIIQRLLMSLENFAYNARMMPLVCGSTFVCTFLTYIVVRFIKKT